MKKITQSFLAVSLSTAILFQNMVIVSNAEEIKEKNTYIDSQSSQVKDCAIQPDPETIPHRSMGETSSVYSYSNSLSNLETKTLTKSSYIGIGKVTSNDPLNVRTGPSTSYSIIGTLKNGDQVNILGRDRNWYKISANNLTGYVSSSYIKLSPLEKGIDVSKWNGNVDWDKVKADGIDYVIIRAGYGNSNVDPYFKSHIEGASKAGLKIGIYWFSYATSVEKAKEEAAKCLETIAPYKNKISYPVFYDFEYASVDYATKMGVKITKDLSSKMAHVFLNEIKNAGYINGIYTNKDFGDRYFDEDILYNNYLWVAQYASTCTYPRPYMMWQFTEKGTINGIGTPSKPVYFDVNYTYLKPYTDEIINGVPESKIDLSSATVNSIDSQTYTGSSIEPSVTVTLNGKTLKLNEDYTLTYSNNVNVGNATITINGIGNYTGSKKVNFNIAPKKLDISSATVNSIGSKTYTGASIKPSVTVTLNNKTLKLNKDYNVSYSNNKNIGTAKILIKGIGEYEGEKTVTFNIIPPKVTNLKSSKRTYNSITLSWDKIDNVTGYKVYRYDVKTESYKLIKTISDASTTSYTNSKLTSATKYLYKVRSYKIVNNKTHNGDYSSSLAATTKPPTPTVKLTSPSTKKIKLTWTNISSRTTGYNIYMATSKNGTYKNIGSTSKKSFTKGSLKKGKTYYFKVRAYRTIDGKKVYSSYSSIKSIKCK
ncbi:MAG: SH3 domain-containing protein [Clostridium sp.]|nr:SH3 domain-containing protein [Clostridium sp.]